MTEPIVETPAPGVALVRLNRPEALNALNAEVRVALAEHFRKLGADPEVRCVVITGDERAFAAGADLKEMAERDARRGRFQDRCGHGATSVPSAVWLRSPTWSPPS